MPLDIATLDTEEPAMLSWHPSRTFQVLEFVNNTDSNYVAVSQYQTGSRLTGVTLDICLLNKDLGQGFYWSFSSFSLLMADFTVTAEVVL